MTKVEIVGYIVTPLTVLALGWGLAFWARFVARRERARAR